MKHHKNHHHKGHAHKHSMETPQQQTQSSSPSKAGNVSHTSKLITIVILLVLLGVAAVAALVKSPQLLQKLPQIKQKSAMKTYTPPKLPPNFNMALQNGPYRCPLTGAVCKTVSNYQNGWLFATLSPFTPLFAAFDGTFEAQAAMHPTATAKEPFTLGVLTNMQRGLRAYYYYKAKAGHERAKTVKEGETVATASADPLTFYNNKSFAFQLIKFGTKSSSVASLSVDSFK